MLRIFTIIVINMEIRASNEVYFQKTLVKSYVNNLCHAWMSMEGQAEAYNQTWLSSVEVQLVKLFLAKNPSIGNHFHQKISSVNKAEDLFKYILTV